MHIYAYIIINNIYKDVFEYGHRGEDQGEH